MRPILAATFAVLLSLTASAPARALALGQVDTFESGTTEGWFAGGGPSGGVPPQPPSVQLDGGPGGVGDAFLLVQSTGQDGAPGGRLVAMNASQWAGSYAAAGVASIAMSLRNFGPADVTIRLLLEDPTSGPPQNQAVTAGVTLPAGGDWTSAVFPLDAASLTVLSGDAATLLGNVTLLRIFHAPTAVFPGPAVATALGVDDVRAVPEPASGVLVLAGVAALARRPRR